MFVIFFTYIAGYIAHALYLGKTVYGDGAYYYAWLAGETSKYAIGPALFWAPAWLATHNELVVGATGVLAVIFGLVLLSRSISLLTIYAIAFSTNLFFYGSLDPVNSHAFTFFAATVFLTLLPTKNSLALGFSLGMLGLMRPQDLIYVLLLPFLNKSIIAGFLLAFLPQLIAWQLTSGNFLISPYFLHEGFDFLHPHIFGVLFNTGSGLFLWTPITILGVAGLLYAKKYRMLLVFLCQLYLISSWSTWWQGASYSGRMFVSTLPLLAFGIDELFKKFPYLKKLTIPLSLLNILAIIYFLVSH